MAGVKIHELAKEFCMPSKELMAHLKRLNIPAKSHASTLVDAYVEIVRLELADEIASCQAAAAEAILAEERKVEDERKAEETRLAEEEEARRRAVKEKHDRERAARDAEREIEAQAAAAVQAAEEKAAASVAPEPAVEVVPTSAPDSIVSEPTVPEPVQLVSETVDEPEVEPAAVQPDAPEAVVEEAVATVTEVPVVEPAARPLGLLDHIEAEKARLEEERKEAREAKRAGKRKQAVEPASTTAPEDDEYAQMAKALEEKQQEEAAVVGMKIQADKIVGGGKPTAGADQKPAGKKGKKGKKGRVEVAEEAPRANVDAVDLPHGGDAVSVPEGSTVQEFADILGVASNDVIKRLFLLGNPLTVTQSMSNDLIELIADDLERPITITKVGAEDAVEFVDAEEDLKPRPPVVTVMGHVDHGKTSLLDAIRETGVAESEAGGITQHIGASIVKKNGRLITFIDTPGHEAFTAMRARGANITDIVILVVAADDGVMPQTVEAISHARAAGVPIVVAVNKIDKEGANPDQVRQMLTEYEIVPEEWGGTNIFVNVSAKKRTGIDDLLEMLLLQADILELKANPDALASGTVIESKLDKGRGPVATVLVRRGTLKVGDALVAGSTFGRVRALITPLGKIVDTAGPSDAVEVLGLASVPQAGDDFRVFSEEREARSVADDRAMRQRLKDQQATKRHVSLDDLFSAIESGELKDLNLVVKADVQGSIEALSDALDKMDQSEVRINIIHSGVGGITETDVGLAMASNAIIIGFGVRPTPKAKAMAAEEKVDVRMYRIIYQAIEEINAARVGMLSPDFRDEDTGTAEIREVFRVPKIGAIAGCYVLEGEISRDDQVRIVRDGTIVYEGKISSLRRVKDDVKSVRFGYECGIGIEGFQDIKPGDVIEGFKTVEVARTS